MISWKNNIQHLRDIKTSNPIFWDCLVNLATVLKESNFEYINDHNLSLVSSEPSEEELDDATSRLNTVVICQKMVSDNEPCKMKHKLSYGSSYGMIFPGPYVGARYQCKNPLFLRDDGRIHLSIYATGLDLHQNDQDVLAAGEIVIQKHRQEYTSLNSEIIEMNFALPVNMFVNTLLEE